MMLVYIVEDDCNIREIESFSLKNAGYVVEEFSCARTFWSRLCDQTPDLVVLDIMLPDEDGLEIVTRLRDRAATRNLPVIMVTAKTSEIDRVKGLDAGADDYLVKPFGVMELISRVKALLRRSKKLNGSGTVRVGEIFLDEQKRCVTVDGQGIELTYKEFELLKMFLYNAGIVLQREDIMERVWGVDFEGESRTLDMHVKTLRRKLGQSGSRIQTVRNVGYRLE